MIQKTFIPRHQRPSPIFRYELKFDGDPKKIYSCSVIRSNLEAPKFIGFRTDENGQNWMILEFVERCNNAEMTIQFHTQAEAVEKKKVAFLTWLLGYFTWLNFIFRIFSLKTLKFITKAIAVGIAVPVAFGLIYAITEYTYEGVTGDDFEDSAIVEYWSNWTIPAIGKYFREDALDDAGDLKDFMMEKSEYAIEATKEKADDLKEKISDKIDDIKD